MMFPFLLKHLPTREEIRGRYFEPFVGGIRKNPVAVWTAFREMPSGKAPYKRILKQNPDELDLIARATRLLYLN